MTDTLNTTPWTAVDLDWGDGETVRIVDDPDPDTRARPSTSDDPGRTPVPAIPGPARIIHAPRADDHRADGIRNLNEAGRHAIDLLTLPHTGARDWARSLGYDPKSRVVRALDDAAAAVREALDLVDAAENG